MLYDNKIVQSFWMGTKLSEIELLCIRSFTDNGHEFHLYTNNNIKNVPKQVKIKRISDIVALTVEDRPNELLESELKYKLLSTIGGWWVNMDIVCLKPFDFSEPYVFSSDFSETQNRYSINSFVIKCPKNSVFTSACLLHDPAFFQSQHSSDLHFALSVFKCRLEGYVKKPEFFCPLPSSQFSQIMQDSDLKIGLEHYAICLWKNVARPQNKNMDIEASRFSLFNRLNIRFPVTE